VPVGINAPTATAGRIIAAAGVLATIILQGHLVPMPLPPHSMEELIQKKRIKKKI
jgi:hypothetical protein